MLSLLAGSLAASADVVLDWNVIAVNTAVANKANPFAQDEVLAGISVVNGITSVVSDSFTGTYSVDMVHGSGRVDSTITYTNSGPGPELIFYITGNGNGPLILDADTTSLGTGTSVGTGIAYLQAAPPFSFNGPFGVTFVQSTGSSLENDATGQANVNGSSNTLTGSIDTNLSTTPSPNTSLAGSFSSPASGRFTGTLTNAFFTAPNATISVAFYPVDAADIFFIETDFSVSTESTLGHFATRTPVCSLPVCQ